MITDATPTRRLRRPSLMRELRDVETIASVAARVARPRRGDGAQVPADVVTKVLRRLDGAHLDDLRRVEVRKPTGGVRQIYLPSAVDLVLETAVLTVSTGYLRRAGIAPLGVHGRIQQLTRACSAFDLVARTDIARAFDSLDHQVVLRALDRHLQDRELSALVARLLRRLRGDRGLPTGCPLSPALMELALVEADQAVMQHGLALVRYADDIAIPCIDGEKAIDVARDAVQLVGLELNAAKTRVDDLGTGVEFLAHILRRERGRVGIFPSATHVEDFGVRERRYRAVDPALAEENKEVLAIRAAQRVAGLRSFYSLADQPTLEGMLAGLAPP